MWLYFVPGEEELSLVQVTAQTHPASMTVAWRLGCYDGAQLSQVLALQSLARLEMPPKKMAVVIPSRAGG